MEADITITNIVREVVNKCKTNDLKIEENFVTYYVQLLHLDPAWGITADFLLNRSNVQKFVQYCVTTMREQNYPFLVALRTQFHFKANLTSKQAIAEKNRIALQNRLSPLEAEILQTKKLVETDDYEKLYKRIVYYITLLSGLGNPTVSAIYKEACTALQSIFSEDDVQEFLSFPKEVRSDQLIELTELVTGIRLFNRDCKKGGEGIEDLPRMLTQALAIIDKDLPKILVFIMDRVNVLTTAVDNCFKINKNDSGYYITHELPEGVSEGALEFYKDVLVVYRQYEVYIRKVLLEIKSIEESGEEIYLRFQETVVKLHNTVKHRTAIPTHLVFPLFCKISDIWCSLQDEVIYLAKLNQIVLKMQSLVTELPLDENVLESMVGPDGFLTDAERLEKAAGKNINGIFPGVTILRPRNVKNFDQLPLEYLGFCAWKLVETQGALIPANPNLGVVSVDNKNYAFSCAEAAEAFCMQPKRYIMEALVLARKKVELINILQLYDKLVEVQNVEELFQKSAPVIITYEADVQTEIHPIATKIDPEYMWNVWDLKRQALLLANLSRCKTKITQTDKLSTHMAVKTQTYESKEKEIQTKKDNYTNVPKPSNFIYGLRGRKDDKQFIVELTRPVKE